MIITNNEEALRVACLTVLPDEVGELVERLEQELNNSARLGRPGIGLAAPQIGIAKDIAIVRLSGMALNLVNAKLIQGYDQAMFQEEGCLSFPGRLENTMRYQEVQISNHAQPERLIATGLLAVACQHELDHLNFTLLMDRAIPKQKTIIKTMKVKPNEPCPCGEIDLITQRPKKYKRCHGR